MASLWFTSEWAQAFREQIQNNEIYKKSAETWEWPLILVLEKNADSGILEDAGIYLDLWHGDCRAARMATREDFDQVPYIISGSALNWKSTLEGKFDPIAAIVLGKLKLTKGSMTSLSRYVRAAKELVVSAQKIETIFHDGV